MTISHIWCSHKPWEKTHRLTNFVEACCAILTPACFSPRRTMNIYWPRWYTPAKRGYRVCHPPISKLRVTAQNMQNSTAIILFIRLILYLNVGEGIDVKCIWVLYPMKIMSHAILKYITSYRSNLSTCLSFKMQYIPNFLREYSCEHVFKFSLEFTPSRVRKIFPLSAIIRITQAQNENFPLGSVK